MWPRWTSYRPRGPWLVLDPPYPFLELHWAVASVQFQLLGLVVFIAEFLLLGSCHVPAECCEIGPAPAGVGWSIFGFLLIFAKLWALGLALLSLFHNPFRVTSLSPKFCLLGALHDTHGNG